MGSANALYRIFIASTNNIYICRLLEFAVLQDKKELPSFNNLMDHVSQQRELEELQKEEEEEVQETQSNCFFAHYS